VGVIALVAWSIVANLAIAFNYSFSLGDRLDHMDRLLTIQDAAADVVGPSLAERTLFLDSLPYARYDPTPPGTLAILGDCDALYYSNGDTVDTWVPVEYGSSDFRRDLLVEPTSDLAVGDEIELVRITADPDDPESYWFALTMRIEELRDDEIEYTLEMSDNFGVLPAEDLTMPRNEASTFAITFDKSRRVFFVERNGRNILYGHFDMDPLYDSDATEVSFVSPGRFLGLTLTEVERATPWCDRIAAAAQR
jgi:hypothetical protein